MSRITVRRSNPRLLWKNTMHQVSRRHLLGAGLSASALSSAAVALASPPGADDAEFARLRRNWVEQRVGASAPMLSAPRMKAFVAGLDAGADTWLALMGRSEAPIFADPAASGQEVYNTRVTAERLRVFAIAFATPGSRFFGDGRLLAQIQAALVFLLRDRYNPSKPVVGNWWEWQIGVPMSLLDTLIILQEQLPENLINGLALAIDHHSGDPHFAANTKNEKLPATAANQIWKSHVLFLNSVLLRRPDGISASLDALTETFVYVEAGDGFQRDGSFLQHECYAYTGGYGIDFLYRASGVINALSGSRWSLPYDRWRFLIEVAHSAFAPFMYDGAMMDMVRGRNASRSYSLEHEAGHDLIYSFTNLAEGAPEPEARRLKAWIRRWTNADTVRPFFAYTPKLSLYTAQKVEQYLEEPADAEPVRQERTAYFGGMNRLVHARANFTLGLAMSSTRVSSFECINGENGRGWFTGAGAVYLYNHQLGHYQDHYWPTVDAKRIAGTTVEARPLAFGEGAGDRGAAQVGGVTHGDKAVAYMALAGPTERLSGHKAWFFFGDVLVALGSGLASKSGYPVETTIENRGFALETVAAIRTDLPGHGAIDLNEDRTLAGANWAHIEGLGGYLLLQSGGQYKLKTEIRSGAWSDINTQSYSDRSIHQRRFVTLWQDHGIDPVDARHAYAMAPGATVDQVRALSRAARRWSIINEANTQVVSARIDDAMMTGVIFWAPGAAAGIVASAPVCLLMKRSGKRLDVAVSAIPDSTRAPVHIQLVAKTKGVIQSDAALAITLAEGGFEIAFDFDGTSQQTLQATLSLR